MAKKKPQSKPPTKKIKAELFPKGYEAFLGELKERIRTAQLRASLAVNRELTCTLLADRYRHRRSPENPPLGQRGTRPSGRSPPKGVPWIERFLANEPLSDAVLLPGLQGRCPTIVPRIFRTNCRERVRSHGSNPLGHNACSSSRSRCSPSVSGMPERLSRTAGAATCSPSGLQSGLYERQGKAKNFSRTLPKPQSDLARETLKDPYKFGSS